MWLLREETTVGSRGEMCGWGGSGWGKLFFEEEGRLSMFIDWGEVASRRRATGSWRRLSEPDRNEIQCTKGDGPWTRWGKLHPQEMRGDRKGCFIFSVWGLKLGQCQPSGLKFAGKVEGKACENEGVMNMFWSLRKGWKLRMVSGGDGKGDNLVVLQD